jgi:choline dehydrogenase-like flavoprotein
MICVIGSGPAGVTCASVLLSKGLKVTMIDAGIDLEPERREAVQRLAGSRPEQWSGSDLRIIRENMAPGANGIPLKRAYGSDFPYREALQHIPLDRRGVDVTPSLARGGFSNVWGAVVAPYVHADLADWPQAARNLAPHYEAVLRSIDLAAEEDGLASLLPLHSRRHQPLRPSRQAAAFLADARRHREALGDAGVDVGRARLAVRAAPGEADAGCVYCGLCLYGCPYGLIYNSQSTLGALRRDPDFRYESDIVVDRLEEDGRRVRVHGYGRTDGSRFQFDTERVYLACGTFSTTKILLQSLEAHDEIVTIRDSQYFLLPLLRYRATPAVETESLHTLAQAFLEIRDPAVSPRTVHIEVFTYNDLLPAAAERRLGWAANLLRLPIRGFVRRVLVGQCFLHSDVSPTIEARLVRSDGGQSARLVLEGRPRPESERVVGRVWRKLLAHRRHLRALPVPPLIAIATTGRGFHSGGSFPMRADPTRFESDIWGRPYGLRRVHAVDATVFPTIPATTITLPVMATAHRIASGYDEL